MPRVEVDLGEMAQPLVGAIRSSCGLFGTRGNPKGAESRQARQAGYVPPKPRQRPCCKTCGDRGCVGHCKF